MGRPAARASRPGVGWQAEDDPRRRDGECGRFAAGGLDHPEQIRPSRRRLGQLADRLPAVPAEPEPQALCPLPVTRRRPPHRSGTVAAVAAGPTAPAWHGVQGSLDELGRPAPRAPASRPRQRTGWEQATVASDQRPRPIGGRYGRMGARTGMTARVRTARKIGSLSHDGDLPKALACHRRGLHTLMPLLCSDLSRSPHFAGPIRRPPPPTWPWPPR